MGRLELIPQPGGEVVLVGDGGAIDPAITGMLDSGEIELDVTAPAESWWRTALLKHAYLATCLHLRDIPSNPEAEAVRAELVTARDDGDALVDGPGDRAGRLVMARHYGKPLGTRVVTAVADFDEGPVAGFVLGDFGFVSSPLPESMLLA